MSEETLDPRHEQLVAALYGELSEEEEAEFHRQLLADADLRAEWEELRGARTLLGEWTLEEETAPDFVFLDGETAPHRRGRRLTGWLRGALAGPAWGLAALAAMAVLVFAGFRVDRVDGGLVFRFGPAPTPTALMMAGSESLDTPAGATPAAPPTAFPADAESPVMLRTVSAMLSDYQDRRNAELAYILRGMVDELRKERAKELEDLKARVDVVGLLMAEQNRTNARIQTLIDRDRATPDAAPLNPDEDN
jgi:hypothetical protein